MFLGQIIYDPSLEAVFNSIRRNRLPDQWLRYSYPSIKSCSSYLIDFNERFEWFKQWWISKCMPQSYWISAFFYPRNFLACIKLSLANEYEVPIEKLTFDFVVVDG